MKGAQLSKIPRKTVQMPQMQQKWPFGEAKQPTEKAALVNAIDTTLRAIEDRTKLYRNLVVAVSIVSFVSVILAVFFRQWLAVCGLIIIVPLTGAFLFLDSHLVLQWRAGILDMARLRGLDLAMFLKIISGFRQLPPDSLKAMLATLPANSDVTQRRVPRDEPSVVNDEVGGSSAEKCVENIAFNRFIYARTSLLDRRRLLWLGHTAVARRKLVYAIGCIRETINREWSYVAVEFFPQLSDRRDHLRDCVIDLFRGGEAN